MTRPLLVAEDITKRRPLFRVFGVTWWATRYAWIGPASWIGLGLVMALAERRPADAAGVMLAALGYGAVLYAANVLHSLGHVVAGRLVGAPVEAIVMSSTRDVTLYARPGAAATARRRLGRSLGGPLANLAAGCALVVAGRVAQASWAVVAGVVNLGVAAWTLMPVPSLDGWVIWSMLRRQGAATARRGLVVLVTAWPLLGAGATRGDEVARESAVFEAVFRQQLEEHLDATERARGTVLCLGIDPGGAPQSPTQDVMRRLSADPAVRRIAECDPRPKGAVESRSLRPAILVTAGPIQWIAADEAHVTVSYFRSARQSARRKYRVVEDRSGWVCLGQIILDAPL